mgnify:CR=1 FL=1
MCLLVNNISELRNSHHSRTDADILDDDCQLMSTDKNNLNPLKFLVRTVEAKG